MDDWGHDDTPIRAADWGGDDHVLKPGGWGHGDQVLAQSKGFRGAEPTAEEQLIGDNPLSDPDVAAANAVVTKGLPVAGAYVPQTEKMTSLETKQPGAARMLRTIGSAIGTAPMVIAAPEAFGAGVGQSLLTRAGMGAATNAGLSGADTLARTGDAKEAGKDALAAALIGGGLPVVGSAGSSIAPYVKPILKHSFAAESAMLPGGWIPESIMALATNGLSEIPLGAYRMAKGVRAGINEVNSAAPKPQGMFPAAQHDMFAGAMTPAELDVAKLGTAAMSESQAQRQAELLKGAAIRQALAQALTGQGQ